MTGPILAHSLRSRRTRRIILPGYTIRSLIEAINKSRIFRYSPTVGAEDCA